MHEISTQVSSMEQAKLLEQLFSIKSKATCILTWISPNKALDLTINKKIFFT